MLEQATTLIHLAEATRVLDIHLAEATRVLDIAKTLPGIAPELATASLAALRLLPDLRTALVTMCWR
jgi:hypothetical protein